MKAIKIFFSSLFFVLLISTTYAAEPIPLFSQVGDWYIYGNNGVCFAITPAYPPKTARRDTLGLRFDQKGAFLALMDPQFNFPVGSYPIGLQHDGNPSFNGSVTGVVTKELNKGIAVRLTPEAYQGIITAANLTITLGTHQHFFSTNGGVEAARTIAICEKNGVDPFTSDPVK